MRKKNLVIVEIGKISQPMWMEIANNDRNFDIAVIDGFNLCKDFESNFDYYFSSDIPFFGAIYDFFNHKKDVLESYDYVMLIHDGIEIYNSCVNEIFEQAALHQIWIAHPALTHRSHKCEIHYLFYSDFTLLYQKNHLEFERALIGKLAPIFSKEALNHFLLSFKCNTSGYYLNVLWSVYGFYNHKKIGLLHKFPIIFRSIPKMHNRLDESNYKSIYYNNLTSFIHHKYILQSIPTINTILDILKRHPEHIDFIRILKKTFPEPEKELFYVFRTYQYMLMIHLYLIEFFEVQRAKANLINI